VLEQAAWREQILLSERNSVSRHLPYRVTERCGSQTRVPVAAPVWFGKAALICVAFLISARPDQWIRSADRIKTRFFAGLDSTTPGWNS
jgi:hypothetical protein